MSQLQRKSVVASATGHFFLLALLLVGPAFFMARYEPTGRSKTEPTGGTITVFPNDRVEKTLYGSERPNPAPTSSSQSPAQTTSQQVSSTVHKLPQVDLSKPVFRNRAGDKTSRPGSGTSELAANREQQVSNVLESLRQQLFSGAKPGPIISGATTDIDYRQFVEAVYDNAWLAPDDLADDDATVKVSVTVSRNGAVVSSKILKRSGVSALDKSIEGLLDRVKTIGRPFPDSEKEVQRTFVINFNLRARRLL